MLKFIRFIKFIIFASSPFGYPNGNFFTKDTLRPDETADNLPYEKVGNNEPVCIADEVPFDIPDTWEWVRLGSIVSVLGGKRIPAGRKLTKENSGHTYIRVSDMKDGYISKDDLHYVPEDIFPNISKYIINKEDVFITVAGTIGRVGKIPPELDGSNLTENADRLVFSLINQDWLIKTLQSDLVQNQIANATTKVGQPKLAIARIENILVALPPILEQYRIVSKVEEILALVDQYEVAYSEVNSLNNSFSDLLKKSILQEAVQGKLVLQDPNDEPASVLLERIRAEKQALIKAGKIKKDKNESVIFRRDNSHYEKRGSEEVCIDDEIPFEIPDTWEWCRIGSLLQVNPRNNLNNLSDDTDAGFVPMVLIKDGFNNEHSFEERKWGKIKSGFTHFANNDVIVAKITPCFQNRKSAVIANLPNGIGAGTTELHVLRDVTSQLCMQYILLLFKTNEFIKNGVKNFSGTAGQQRIGKDFISNYLIPLPPVKEQERIVNSVLKVFSRVNFLAD